MRAREEAEEGRRSLRLPQTAALAASTSAASAASSASPRPTGAGMMELQRSAGNAAVCRMLDSRAALPVQRMPGENSQEPAASASGQAPTVISGHGRFGDPQRLPKNPDNPRSRALKATFTVPEGIELVVYAPPGAWLENEVAKLVESGEPPAADDLEMVDHRNKRKPMPDGFPKTYTAGEEVINYKLMPLAAKHLAEGATSVEGGTLKDKVAELAAAHAGQEGDDALTVHYACCGVGSSSTPEIDRLFTHRNYTVMLRATSPSPSPEPEKPAKRPRK
ncbi:putative adhesin [Streptomyces sp. cmx-18-6]|uniref:putative adhesin n=1 Tax=Streptomyces sp. cmx-18-6 TaxID=2790930 RepID=UPI003980D576